MGLWLLAGSVAVTVAVISWIKRRQQDIDDYYEDEEREFQDPPVFSLDPGPW